jgi:hypothetical protein
MKVVQDTMGVQTLMGLQGEDLVTATVQDCTPILEDAHARQSAGFTGTSEMKHAARLPMVVVETYCNTNGVTFDECMANPVHFKRMLSDPDLSGFRIWAGAV